jgi:hypothetical protein
VVPIQIPALGTFEQAVQRNHVPHDQLSHRFSFSGVGGPGGQKPASAL